MAKKNVPKDVVYKAKDPNKRDWTSKQNELDEVDHKMLGIIDKQPNITYKELGPMVSMSESGCRKRYQRPVFLRALEEINKSTWDLILRAKKISARRLMTLANHTNPSIALKAAMLLFGPTLQDTTINVNEFKEVVYKTRFGEGGQMISEKEEVPLETPKNALELLEGG